MSSSEPKPDTSHQSPHEPIGATQSTIHFVTQDDCFKHVYRRSKDVSTIFERPQRLRFVNLGLAAAVAWDLVHNPSTATSPQLLTRSNGLQSEDQTPQQNSLSPLIQSSRVTFSKSKRKISRNDSAFEKVHDQPNQLTIPPPASTPGASTAKDTSTSIANATKLTEFLESTTYLDQLIGLCRRASEIHHLGLSEVPEHLPQGDLYLSLGSEAAILGAIGACYEAIDSVLKVGQVELELIPPSASTHDEIQSPQYKKAFANIRPPGHHCTDSEPMGFCWVNNVLIGCMYSYLTYGIDRICIVDIDLHHGNGSQQIVWNLNSQSESSPEPNTQKMPSNSSYRRPLKISYSSLHDINSYPCEDGDPDRIKDASLNICVGNSINQFIQNLHIEDWSDEEDFYARLYPNTWMAFEQHMLKFFQITDASPDHSLIFVSAGFDACEYETGQMSRFAKKLPASFFNRFAFDISRFSDAHCHGRLISVLEGGYSEQTLTGSSLSYILGLMDSLKEQVGSKSKDDSPWSLSRINQLLKMCKKGDLNRKSNSSNKNNTQPESLEASHAKDAEWIAQTRQLFEHIDSYEEVKSELNKSNRLEEKQIKLQQAMSQLAVEVHSPEGLRRSQRHTSSTKKTDLSPSETVQLPPKSTQQPANSGTQPLKSPRLGSGSTTNGSLNKSTNLARKSSNQAVAPTNNKQLNEITTEEDKNPLENSTIETKDQSINDLLENLNLSEDPIQSTKPTNPPVQPTHDRTSSNNPDHPSQTLNPPLPKVKLVWKAGGILGS